MVPLAPQNWTRRNIHKGDRQFARGHQNRVHLKYDPEAQTKICTRCPEKGPQPIENFHRKARSLDGHAFVCKVCRSLESQQNYAALSEEEKQRMRDRDARRHAEAQAIVKERLITGCLDCGNIDLRVLEFDHVQGEKTANISRLIRSGSKQRLLDELEKCEVVCANCHRIRTTKSFGWWRGELG